MNEKNHRTRGSKKGDPQWERSTIWGMLRNPAYQETRWASYSTETVRSVIQTMSTLSPILT